MKRDPIREGRGGFLMIRRLKGSSFLDPEISQNHIVLTKRFIASSSGVRTWLRSPSREGSEEHGGGSCARRRDQVELCTVPMIHAFKIRCGKFAAILERSRAARTQIQQMRKLLFYDLKGAGDNSQPMSVSSLCTVEFMMCMQYSST